MPRTSVSRRSLNRLISPQAAPICRATVGSLSGPRTTRATIKITASFAGSRNIESSLRPDAGPPSRAEHRRSGARPTVLRPRIRTCETAIGGVEAVTGQKRDQKAERGQKNVMCDKGQIRMTTRPTINEPDMGPNTRLSEEKPRLSPITK